MSPIDERLKSLNIVLPDVMPRVVDVSISPRRIIRQYMRIPNPNRDCWSADHDNST